MRLVLALVVMVASVGGSGCATVVHGTRQTVHVTSDPPGATVSVLTVAPGKPEIVRTPVAGTTPLDLSLTRSNGHIVVRLTAEGCQPIDVPLRRTTSGWTWGNAWLANPASGQGADSASDVPAIYAAQAVALAGAVALDFATGAAYKLPKVVFAKLCEEKRGS